MIMQIIVIQIIIKCTGLIIIIIIIIINCNVKQIANYNGMIEMDNTLVNNDSADVMKRFCWNMFFVCN